jgi:hypothetical protein
MCGKWAWGLGVLAVGFALSSACGDTSRTVEVEGVEPVTPDVGTPVPPQEPLLPQVPSTSPDAGGLDAGTTVSPDAGTPGPWPVDALRNYSRDFSVGTPQSVAFDEAMNLWLLQGDRIGVLRPGDAQPTWTQGVGQARLGFGVDTLATGATVICGGSAGRAYVGYSARDLRSEIPGRPHAYIPAPGEPYYTPERYAEYQKGDLDIVRLEPTGAVTLEEHLWRTPKGSNANKAIGIHNTNDFHYDEDRTIWACERVTRGPFRGDLYVTTNHGVTRVQGLWYNSHRHPGWYKEITRPDGTTGLALQTVDMHGLGIAPNGDVLVANDQNIGVLVPNARLEDWDREQTFNGPTPWRFKTWNDSLNDQDTKDHWRGFAQTTAGTYYLSSLQYGLWKVTPTSRSSGTWTKIAGLPTDNVPALRATDDGALYIGTGGAGLWRLEADGTTLTRVPGLEGTQVKQLVYEPNVTPRMLGVLTEAGLTVLRGP